MASASDWVPGLALGGVLPSEEVVSEVQQWVVAQWVAPPSAQVDQEEFRLVEDLPWGQARQVDFDFDLVSH